MTAKLVQTALVGCGGMARHHIRDMVKQLGTTAIAVVCEPSPAAYQAAAQNGAPVRCEV